MSQSIKNRAFDTEFNFSTSRSSGPGGQNVNKVNSKVELRFNVNNSLLLSEIEKHKIRTALNNRINSENELILVSQSERTQLQNKLKVIERFYQLIVLALKPVKKRKRTKPTRSSIESRIKRKKQNSEKKNLRRKID